MEATGEVIEEGMEVTEEDMEEAMVEAMEVTA